MNQVKIIYFTLIKLFYFENLLFRNDKSNAREMLQHVMTILMNQVKIIYFTLIKLFYFENLLFRKDKSNAREMLQHVMTISRSNRSTDISVAHIGRCPFNSNH